MFQDATLPVLPLSPTLGGLSEEQEEAKTKKLRLVGRRWSRLSIKGALETEPAQSIRAPRPTHIHHEGRLCELRIKKRKRF